jgi:hypothetical protein
MMRARVAALTAALVLSTVLPAAGASAPAASPFEEVPAPSSERRSHLGAYLTFGAGLALVGASYALKDRADDTYADYLAATDPAAIESLYDETERYDRLSTGAMLGGQALIAAGVYLRFIHRPSPASRVQLSLGATRCALSYRF